MESSLTCSALQVKVSLDGLTEDLSNLSNVGDCVARVEHLLKELKSLEEKAQVSPSSPSGHLSSSAELLIWVIFFSSPLQATLEKAQLHALHGEQLIQSNHYAVDSIRPKCVELRRVCDDFSNGAKKKTDVLSKSLALHVGIDKVRAPPGGQGPFVSYLPVLTSTALVLTWWSLGTHFFFFFV